MNITSKGDTHFSFYQLRKGGIEIKLLYYLLGTYLFFLSVSSPPPLILFGFFNEICLCILLLLHLGNHFAMPSSLFSGKVVRWSMWCMRVELAVITIRIMIRNHIFLAKMSCLSVESHSDSVLNNPKYTSRLKFMDLRYRKASSISIPKICINCKVASWWDSGTGPYLPLIWITLNFI